MMILVVDRNVTFAAHLGVYFQTLTKCQILLAVNPEQVGQILVAGPFDLVLVGHSDFTEDETRAVLRQVRSHAKRVVLLSTSMKPVEALEQQLETKVIKHPVDLDQIDELVAMPP